MNQSESPDVNETPTEITELATDNAETISPPVTEESTGPLPGEKNIPILDGLPIAHLTANLRHGPNLHDGLLAFLPLVGVWRGQGKGAKGSANDICEFEFGQELIISHDGNNYLSWNSVIWEIPPTEGIEAPIIARETGFLAISPNDEIELLLSHSNGFVEIYYGSPLNQTSWELATDVVIQAGSAHPVGGAKRLYGLVNSGDLAYVEERINPDGELIPAFSAQLIRYAG